MRRSTIRKLREQIDNVTVSNDEARAAIEDALRSSDRASKQLADDIRIDPRELDEPMMEIYP